MTDLYTQPGITPQFLNTSPEIPALIGLSGWARSGKDTVAGILRDAYGFKRRAFADKLKAYTYAVNPVIYSGARGRGLRLQEIVDPFGWEAAKEWEEVRRLLQEIGTHTREFFYPDVWVDSVWKDIQPDEITVISDVRFKNEAQRICEDGGVVLRVNRPGVGPANDHISEHDLDDWDFHEHIVNSGTLEELVAEVQQVVESVA